jgi:hypothetical protein
MAGYSARQSSFTTGDTITAAHSNNEFNQILAAFNVSTGHTHDGSTAGDGGPLSTLFSNTISMGTGADTDIAVTFNANSNDGVITWMEDEDYFQFSDDLLLSTTEKIQFRDTAIYINSSADGQLDLVADTEIQIAATTVDINGNVDISGSLTLGGTTITSTGAELNILDGVTSTAAELNILDGVTSTAAELNILDGVTSTAAELNILDGVTSTAAELNILDGVTSTAAELNLLDGSTAGTVVASKAVVVDSNKDLTGIRNLTIAGDLTISGDDLTMATNTAGNLLIADGTNYNPTAVTDLSEISSVASGDVLLAVDASGGGLKKITRSTLVAGLATSSGIANVAEDSTPQLGGDLDVDGNGLVSTSNGNIALTPNGSGVVRIDGSNGIDMQSGSISIKNSGTQSYVRFYCESSNAHYTQLQSAAHSDYSGNVTLTLPPTTDTLVGKATTDTLTNKTLTTPVIAEIDSGSTITLDATTDIVLDADGGDIFFKDAGTTFGSATNTSGNLIIKSGTTTALTFSGANATAAGNLIVTGDLTVNGTTTTVNSTTVTIDDPIFTLGGDSAPGSDDNKDRGIEFRYHNGSAAKVGFFGYDDSAGAFTFIPDATNSSEVFSGTAGNVVFGNIAGTLTTAAQTNITSVGALDGGSITSGFGNIDTGSSTITTTGLISGGSLDIDNVLINGTTIGHTDDTDLLTLADGALTVAGTLEATGNITGTLATAAQTNITSLGTLSALTVDNIAINGTTIGHTDDTDLMTLASGGLTVAGTVQGTTITATTAVVPDASGGADLGSTSLEWGDLYIADDKKIYLGSDQDVSIEYDEDGNDTTAVVAAGGVSLAPHGTSTGNGTELRFQELAANGANYVGFKAPDAIASNEVWVLPNADGSADQVLKTDGSNTLSWADAGGGGVIDRVADGDIAIRKPVILTAAGKAQEIAQSSSLLNTDFTAYTSSNPEELAIGFDANSNKVVIVYHDTSNSNYGTAVVGTVSGSSISFGSAVVFESASSSGFDIAFDPDNNKMLIVYTDVGNNRIGTYVVGTVSGTSISFGSPATIHGGRMDYKSIDYDTNADKFLLGYKDYNNTRGEAIVGTLSGTSVSWGSSSSFESGNTAYVTTVFDSAANKFGIFYSDVNDSFYGKSVVATISSTSVSFGSITNIRSSQTTSMGAAFDSNAGKFALAMGGAGGSVGIVATISGTSISFGSAETITSNSIVVKSVRFDSANNKVAVLFRDSGDNNHGKHVIGTISSTDISFGSEVTLSDTDPTYYQNMVFDSENDRFVYIHRPNASLFTSVAVNQTNLTSTNYLGVAKEAISDTATGKIHVISGLSTGHSSLTIGSNYFATDAGAIATSGTTLIGKALSATEILLKT